MHIVTKIDFEFTANSRHSLKLICHIFKTDYKDKPVYVISLDKKFDGELKVMQPESKSDLEARIEALEKEIYKASKPEKKEEIIVSH